MGYRSTFVTNDCRVKITEEFYEKWQSNIHFNPFGYDEELNGDVVTIPYGFPISSKVEGKMYGMYAELIEDLQKLLKDGKQSISLVILHEDDACDQYIITREIITMNSQQQQKKNQI